MKKTVIALSTILATTAVNATELSIVGHGFSKHLENHNYNERDFGGALRLENKDFAVQAGAFRNSLYKNSFYAGVDWSPLHYNLGGCLNLDAGLYAGGATGYKYVATPMLGLQSALKCNNMFMRVRAMPDPFYNSKAIGAIEFGYVLKKF